MIVEPDFLDHWKTRMLVRLLGTETAPLYVIRLWAHCQQRKTDRFTGWLPDVLASVCRWDGDGQTLWDSMAKTFIEVDGETVIVHDWADSNASLISSWENGKKGGRPRVSKPTGNPPETHRVTDREEKRREEKTESLASPSCPLPSKPKAKRERNPLIDCLVTIQGEKLEEVTDLAFASAAKALQEIRKVCQDVTPEEMTRRAKNISVSWGGKAVSPMSLAKHWATGAKSVQPQLAWQQPADKPKPMFVQIRELEARIETHPGNWNWLKYNSKTATKEQKDEYRALLKQLEAMQAGQEPLPMEEGGIP